jgi:hypothetical protein
MFKMGSHDPFEYLKHKLWPKERSEHENLVIVLKYMRACTMPHIVEKLLTRVTIFLQTSS